MQSVVVSHRGVVSFKMPLWPACVWMFAQKETVLGESCGFVKGALDVDSRSELWICIRKEADLCVKRAGLMQ